MSAVVVALARLDGALRDGVMVGASTYHETRDLLRRAAPGALLIPEHPDGAFAAAIARRRPACVVVDAVATEHGAAVPDLAGIAAALAAARPGAWLVVDVTGAPLAPSPLALPEARSGRIRALALESLTKHAQLGLDRVTAGAIYCSHAERAAIDDLREHLGANIADASAHALPTPERAVLARRLRTARAQRRRARARAGSRRTTRRRGRAPDRSRRTRTRSPAGDLADAQPGNARRANGFVDAALDRARARGVALVEGASFGLDTTRVYAPSPGEGAECGFVRVSAGIEHAEELRQLARVLVRALREA